MKLLATLLPMGQSFEEPVFGRPSGSFLGAAKKVPVSTCLEKFGPLSLENAQVTCNETPESGKGYCEMQGCNDGYIPAKRDWSRVRKLWCETFPSDVDGSGTQVKDFKDFKKLFTY